ncbi:glycoside hydrolase family 5 protein [Piromyces sp. E2]|nr:glycoside hydrolase family 5 protein [Piromyces sp. E2]|eukprot:OUM68198.1 glycoside hydrolase family 5 protein [Piromyces sp. E2]
MKYINRIVGLIGLSIFFSAGAATPIKNISSKELIKDMKIGWSLGNTMDATCYEQMDYSVDPTGSETCWVGIKTTPELYQKLNELGFNVFRIPTTWTGHFGDAPDYKINEEWMKRVHEIVDYALSTGSYAILNLHHETWNYAFAENVEKAKIIIRAIWTQIANEFSEYDEHLLFEGSNEPRKVDTEVEWNGGDEEGWNAVNEMNAEFIKTVRATGGNNLLRHLLIPTYAASAEEIALAHVAYPTDDDKVIVSVHAYSPYEFALKPDGLEDTTAIFNNSTKLDIAMRDIDNHLRSKNIPVIMGEFGSVDRNNEEERAKWAEYYVSKATALGIPCVLWDNNEFEGDGERLGLFDRATQEIKYPIYYEGLMKGLQGKEKVVPSTPVTCNSNDLKCKILLAKNCYFNVYQCWKNEKDIEKCNQMNQDCFEIWA